MISYTLICFILSTFVVYYSPLSHIYELNSLNYFNKKFHSNLNKLLVGSERFKERNVYYTVV